MPEQSSENQKRKTISKAIDLAALATIFGFAVTMVFNYYQFRTANHIQQIDMMRDLTTEFYADPIYRRIRTSISSCQRLYTGDLGLAYPQSSRGQYDYDEINRYLGFFDDLGFYESQDAITRPMISHSFGAVVVEAYEYKELRTYVDRFQHGAEPNAFRDFQNLAMELESSGDYQAIKERAQKCDDP